MGYTTTAQAAANCDKFYKKYAPWVWVPETNEQVSPTGASCTKDKYGIGLMREPPTDKWELAKVQLLYHKIVFETAEAEFDQMQSFLLGEQPMPPDRFRNERACDEGELLVILKKLRTKATSTRIKFRKAKKQEKSIRPYWVDSKSQDEARKRAQQEAFYEQVRSVQL